MKKVFIFLFFFQTLSYSQSSDRILFGEISIFSEPSDEQLIKWGKYDKFLLETYNYVKNEKKEAKKEAMPTVRGRVRRPSRGQ